MADALRMPKLGQEMTEGRVVEWLKRVGDEVAVGELIALVETDKTTVDLESPVSGYVGAFTVDVDETVEVGTVIAWLLEHPEEAVPTSVGAPAPEPADLAPASASPPAEAGARAPDTGPAEGRVAEPMDGRRIPASPRARRLAEQLGVDLATVIPTGPQGWVTADDVEAAVAGKSGDRRWRWRRCSRRSARRSLRKRPDRRSCRSSASRARSMSPTSPPTSSVNRRRSPTSSSGPPPAPSPNIPTSTRRGSTGRRRPSCATHGSSSAWRSPSTPGSSSR